MASSTHREVTYDTIEARRARQVTRMPTMRNAAPRNSTWPVITTLLDMYVSQVTWLTSSGLTL